MSFVILFFNFAVAPSCLVTSDDGVLVGYSVTRRSLSIASGSGRMGNYYCKGVGPDGEPATAYGRYGG